MGQSPSLSLPAWVAAARHAAGPPGRPPGRPGSLLGSYGFNLHNENPGVLGRVRVQWRGPAGQRGRRRPPPRVESRARPAGKLLRLSSESLERLEP